MEESSSETSSDEGYAQLLEMLKWNTAAMVAILDHHGGTVRIERAVLEGIDLAERAVQISYDEENELYVVEGVTIAVQ